MERICKEKEVDYKEVKEIMNQILNFAKEFNKLYPNLKNLAKMFKDVIKS
jgi:hypothetical protein